MIFIIPQTKAAPDTTFIVLDSIPTFYSILTLLFMHVIAPHLGSSSSVCFKYIWLVL